LKPEDPSDGESAVGLRESSLRADRDLELISRPELRAVRLLLEYLKPELALSDFGVAYTIIVFGGTRLPSPEAARARLAAARKSAGEDSAAARAAESVIAQSRYYDVGREFGRIIGQSGAGPDDNRLVIVTGGGPGGMEAANRGAHEVGAASIGLNITLPSEQQPNKFLTPELSFEFRYFALRKLHFMLRARALVVLPGGYGTLDELFETLCLIQTGRRDPLPVILVGQDFWSRAVDFDFLASEGLIEPEDLDLFQFAETAPEIWDKIAGWYADRGRTIFGEVVPDPSTSSE